MKLLACDFEYNQPNERHMGLVSMDICTESGRSESVWLYNSDEGKARARTLLKRANEAGMTIVAHNVIAEASCFIALGLDPRQFKWVDTYLEYRQLQNGNNSYMYGWHYSESLFRQGWHKSTPVYSRSQIQEMDFMAKEDKEKLMSKAKEDGRDHEQVTPSLAHALKNFLDVEIDVAHKDATRALILERKPEYSAEEISQILGYGAGDTKHLIPLAKKMMACVHERLNKAKALSQEELEGIILWRGRAAANIATFTMYGMPVSRERWMNLLSQKERVIAGAIRDFQQNYFNLWEFDPKGKKYKRKAALANEWVQSMVDRYKLKWPRTKTGDYSLSTADGMPLKAYRDLIPEVLEYNHLMELIKGLGSHATEAEAEERKGQGKNVFSDYLGSDDRVRPYYGPYGTQTARNAPKAVGFIFAQAGWLRGLIEPKPGRVICERDFSSQEAFIAAVLSGDPALMKAYASGDPYLAFAKSTGAAPADATKKSHGAIRNLYKSTVLGLQYGMGADKLCVKLRADTGDMSISVEKAKQLIQQHREVYHVYYAWKERVWERYREDGKPIVLADGWYLDLDSLSKLSTLNMPVQGGGSAIMRHMIDLCLDNGVDVICPVHDSLVYECDEGEQEESSKTVGECMLEACRKVLGVDGMRVGVADVLKNGEYWETEKNAKTLAKNRKYFEKSAEVGEVEDYLETFLK